MGGPIQRFGLVGKKIGYSFSRGYFGEKFEKLGLTDHRYENFDLDRIEAFPGLLHSHPDLKGLNVTIPYKQAIIPYLDSLHPEAKAIGAVNTIAFTDEKRIGYNTDVIGFRESLRPLLKEGDQEALILGTGGASLAVAHALQQLDIRFRYVSRTPGPGQLGYQEIDGEILEQVNLLVQCTPLGTHPNIEACPPLPYEFLGSHHLLFDLVYNPPLSRFLREGLQRGTRIKNGLEMLELQAEAAWKIWNS